jgi:hypothetical protein
MKSLFAAVALVAACSVVNAAEVKKDTKAPVVASKAMTDKDMDKVTAGKSGQAATAGCCWDVTDSNGGIHSVNYKAVYNGFRGGL